MTGLFTWVHDALQWIYNSVSFIPKYVFYKILMGLASVLSAIPVPDFMQQANTAFANIPSSALFFLQVFQVNFGIEVLATALVTRFILRRIPLIGG